MDDSSESCVSPKKPPALPGGSGGAGGSVPPGCREWESGETVPDIVNCDALAELYNVSVDDLLHYDGGELKLGPGPRGKHIFGITVMGERGQVVIPKQARELFQLKPGNRLMVLGDETPGNRGLALVDADTFLDAAKEIVEQFCPKGRRDET